MFHMLGSVVPLCILIETKITRHPSHLAHFSVHFNACSVNREFGIVLCVGTTVLIEREREREREESPWLHVE